MNARPLIDAVSEGLFRQPTLVSESYVTIGPLHSSDRQPLFNLYLGALNRGDWFSSHCLGDLAEQRVQYFIDCVLNKPETLPVLFKVDGEVIGATCLYLTEPNILLIDDTQVDPVKGRKRGAMTAYFRRLIPLATTLRVHLETEFLLTEGSQVLRNILIDELGMVTTGLRVGCYSSFDGTKLESVLTACTPCDELQHFFEKAKQHTPEVSAFADVLRCLDQSKCPPFVVDRCVETSFKFDNIEAISGAIDNQFVPSSFDPFRNNLKLTQVVPGSKSRPLTFLAGEKNNSSRILTYISQRTRQ